MSAAPLASAACAMTDNDGHAAASASIRERGFGLVESLAALVVVSVGMLGIAALNAQGLGANRTALHRTVAVALVSDMAERIRANPQGAAAYNGAAGGDCEPRREACPPEQMAAHELSSWRAQVARQLPGGAGTVAYTPGSPASYTIRVAWQEFGSAADYRAALRVAER